jgi:hypothetical protein
MNTSQPNHFNILCLDSKKFDCFFGFHMFQWMPTQSNQGKLLDGQVAVVTGSGIGIGRAIAQL